MQKVRGARHWCLACCLVLAAGCGYLNSGTWDDDPDNWKKAFGSTKPDAVVVVHSRYWRSPHWSYEAAYVFEIADNAALRGQLFRQNRLVKLTDLTAAERHQRCFPGCPPWFAPKTMDHYEIWGYADDPKSNFRVLIDRETRTIFIVDFQV
jgi:hypothetical protein